MERVSGRYILQIESIQFTEGLDDFWFEWVFCNAISWNGEERVGLGKVEIKKKNQFGLCQVWIVYNINSLELRKNVRATYVTSGTLSI